MFTNIDIPGIGRIEVNAVLIDGKIDLSITNKTAVNIYVNPVSVDAAALKPEEMVLAAAPEIKPLPEPTV